MQVHQCLPCAGPELQLAITGVSDIEESIWAPRYGLKGQLDGSYKVGGVPFSASTPCKISQASHSDVFLTSSFHVLNLCAYFKLYHCLLK